MSRARGRRVMSNDFQNVDYYAATDGTKGRPESTYLDMLERREAEVTRAKLEGREPNLDDEAALPAAVGTQLRVEADRTDNSYYSNPSVYATGVKSVDPVNTLPVDLGQGELQIDLAYAAQVARERAVENDSLVNATDGSTRETASASEVSEL